MSALIFLNENLTVEEATKLYEETEMRKRTLLEKVFEQAKSVHTSRQAEHIAACLPVIMML